MYDYRSLLICHAKEGYDNYISLAEFSVVENEEEYLVICFIEMTQIWLIKFKISFIRFKTIVSGINAYDDNIRLLNIYSTEFISVQ